MEYLHALWLLRQIRASRSNENPNTEALFRSEKLLDFDTVKDPNMARGGWIAYLKNSTNSLEQEVSK